MRSPCQCGGFRRCVHSLPRGHSQTGKAETIQHADYPYYWTQALDGRWEFSSRWSPIGVPDSRVEDAFITATGAPYKVALENYIVNVVNGGSTEVRAMELHDLEVGSQATLNVGTIASTWSRTSKPTASSMSSEPASSSSARPPERARPLGVVPATFSCSTGQYLGMLGADPTLNLDTRLWITRDNNSQFTAGMQSMSLNITQGSLTATNGASLDFGAKISRMPAAFRQAALDRTLT